MRHHRNPPVLPIRSSFSVVGATRCCWSSARSWVWCRLLLPQRRRRHSRVRLHLTADRPRVQRRAGLVAHPLAPAGGARSRPDDSLPAGQRGAQAGRGVQKRGPRVPHRATRHRDRVLATLCLGVVLGPEAPLIAIGSGIGVLALHLVKKNAPANAVAVIGSAGSFAAISTLATPRCPR